VRLKCAAPALVFAGLFAIPALARAAEEAPTPDLMPWKWANFAIFAVLLAFALIKWAPAFFNARSADIQKAIKDATGLKMEADLRYSEVDRKLTNLAGEVEKIRAEAKIEMQREHERVLGETQNQIEHIEKNVAAEGEMLRLEGVYRVRQHTTYLALDLAERRLRDRFSTAHSEDLLKDFANLVEQGKN
jgi:F-type H+-transporting ATPase subunit b